MRVVSFQVRKFRNIVDSGVIEVADAVTCLVGKNEAGKSALLEALYLFNPAYDDSFRIHDQYPKWLSIQDRRRGDLSEHQPIRVTMALDTDDIDAVSSSLGRDAILSDQITISRSNNGRYHWEFELSEEAAVLHLISESPAAVRGLIGRCRTLPALRECVASLQQDQGDSEMAAHLRTAQAIISEHGLADEGVSDHVIRLLEPRLPKFFRFTSYSTLPGRIDLRELASGPIEGPAQSGLQTVRALLALAETDASQLSNEDYELRRGELDAVQIDLTNQVFEYWKQNSELEVAIDVDKKAVRDQYHNSAIVHFLDIRLRDRRSGYSNNFSQRSSGFQWFFSFLAAFSEFEQQESIVVLLDEPGLTLHARAQADFLRFINERLANAGAVIYTTHSPFMVEVDRLDRVRVVEDQGPPNGAVVTKDVLSGDPDSLFPLQAALGYDIAQNLFVGPHNLVVEGTSEFIYLTLLSQLCAASGRESLDPRWRILPAGGATNIPTFVSLVGPHLDVTVLTDSNAAGMQRIKNMIGRGLLKNHRLILASVATTSTNADIEDLFTDAEYVELYNKTYQATLKVGDLPQGDRIVKRIESAAGSFVHGEVAETLLGDHQSRQFSDSTLDCFAILFRAVNETISE